MTLALAEVVPKAEHHQLHQHFITDHKGVYLRFNTHDLFDKQLMDERHKSYRRLRLGRRDIVARYLGKLGALYEEHKILERAKALQKTIMVVHTINDEREVMRLFKNWTNLMGNELII